MPALLQYRLDHCVRHLLEALSQMYGQEVHDGQDEPFLSGVGFTDRPLAGIRDRRNCGRTAVAVVDGQEVHARCKCCCRDRPERTVRTPHGECTRYYHRLAAISLITRDRRRPGEGHPQTRQPDTHGHWDGRLPLAYPRGSG